MQNSVFLAQIIGPYCIIIAVGILANRETYEKMMEDFLKNAALVYIGGILALLFGLLVVLTHNVWTVGWPAFITIFGWVGIIKGTWLLVFPDTVPKFTKVYKKNPTLLSVHLIIVLIIGVGLTIFGYFG